MRAIFGELRSSSQSESLHPDIGLISSLWVMTVPERFACQDVIGSAKKCYFFSYIAWKYDPPPLPVVTDDSPCFPVLLPLASRSRIFPLFPAADVVCLPEQVATVYFFHDRWKLVDEGLLKSYGKHEDDQRCSMQVFDQFNFNVHIIEECVNSSPSSCNGSLFLPLFASIPVIEGETSVPFSKRQDHSSMGSIKHIYSSNSALSQESYSVFSSIGDLLSPIERKWDLFGKSRHLWYQKITKLIRSVGRKKLSFGYVIVELSHRWMLSTMTYTTSTTRQSAPLPRSSVDYPELKTREQRKSFYAYARGKQSKGDVYSTKRIMAVTYVKVMRKHGYGYFGEIVGDRADNAYTDQALRMFTRVGYSKTTSKIFNLGVEVSKNRSRLMRSDELYKFSDGTLTRLLSSLKDITMNIEWTSCRLEMETLEGKRMLIF
ncbi:hypothetical protein Tco_0195551 [Tanacetum coccineum]